MSDAAKRAGEAYVKKNWESFTVPQKLHHWKTHHPNKKVRDLVARTFLESELIAKIQMVAPWYQPGDERSEARLAAMVARKYGVTWWRDMASVSELLGSFDDIWHSVFIEPIAINVDPKNAGKPGRKSEAETWLERLQHFESNRHLYGSQADYAETLGLTPSAVSKGFAPARASRALKQSKTGKGKK